MSRWRSVVVARSRPHMADYKAAKEAWVSGLHGSELLDVALVGLAVPVRAAGPWRCGAQAADGALARSLGSSGRWCIAS